MGKTNCTDVYAYRCEKCGYEWNVELGYTERPKADENICQNCNTNVADYIYSGKDAPKGD